MNVRLLLVLLLSTAALSFPGCDTSRRPALSDTQAGDAPPPAREDRVNPQDERLLSQHYSLLYDLMSKLSDVGKIFMLRDASDETETIIGAIAKVSAEAKKQLESYDEADPELRMDKVDLPKGELDTRDAIKWATTKELLLSGEGFELELVLTQVTSTQYAAFLADTLATRDPHQQRREWLKALSDKFKALNRNITDRLTVKKP